MELLPSKLASLWMDELTLSFSCFTAVKRQKTTQPLCSVKWKCSQRILRPGLYVGLRAHLKQLNS